VSEHRLLVCGGRDFNSPDLLNEALNKLYWLKPFAVLIEGEATGADQMARSWAMFMGIPVEPHWADWDLFGGRAGSIRNSRMLREGKPTMGMAFPGGDGTADMIKKLTLARVPTLVGRWNDGTIIWKNNGC
jgi:hypothetical protein